MQIKQGTTLRRDADFMPLNLISIKEQVHERSYNDSMGVLNDLVNPDTLNTGVRNQLILYIYAKYMDDLGVEEVTYTFKLTLYLINRLIELWFLHLQEKQGLLRLVGVPTIHDNTIDFFQLTEAGVGYELFRTNSGLSLPSIKDIFIYHENEKTTEDIP